MKRHKHSLSHYKLLTSKMGTLVPLTWYEVLPGDTIQMATSALIRLSPLLAPVLHPCRVRIHHYFVPNRIIWEDFEKFITGDDGFNEYAHPHILVQDDVEKGSLHDYLGVKPKDYSGAGAYFSALPYRAYASIFNEHYRDQDLVTELPLSLASGEDSTTNLLIQQSAWEKDYFTTARPWEQKGEDITIPIGDRAPVTGIASNNGDFAFGPTQVFETGGNQPTYQDHGLSANAGSHLAFEEDPDNPGYPNIYADLSQATGISVNELRESLALQRFKEARAQYGSRYVEYLRYLGLRPQDGRLQNPEYLGGGSQVIQFSEVLQTAADDIGPEQTPVGTMRGHGIAAMRSNRFRRFIPEHGIIMSLMSVLPKSIYTDAVHRKWIRFDNMMYFQKELMYLGDEGVLNREVQGSHSQPDGTFGYVPRYESYRYLPSEVHGDFRDTLNYWHLAREFTGDVALNASFIQSVPTTRIHADTESDNLYIMANHSIQARRLLAREPSPRTF